MDPINRPSGLRIRLPETYRIALPPKESFRRPSRTLRTPRTPRPLPSAHTTSLPIDDALLVALQSQDMELVDSVELEPTQEATDISGQRRRNASPVPNQQNLVMELAVGAHEDAVILVEQDGMYAWHLPSEIDSETPSQVPRRRRSPGGPVGEKRIRFDLDIYAQNRTARRRGTRNLLKDMIYDKVKVHVLKFAARIAVGKAMSYLERHVERGLVIMEDNDPAKWKRVDNLSSLKFPSARPARILLCIHGTFSSTIGAYSALGVYPWGKNLLEQARESYDAIIGFDHYTLSEDPLQNATDLLQRLQETDWAYPPRFDVITHSRGGLVFRSLVELLLPLSNWQPYFDRVIYVGVPNLGTALAEPDNWHTLVDLYTNLAVAASRALALLPNAAVVATVMRETIQGVGAFVKYLVTHAVTEGDVPGIAVMKPDSEFVTYLNEVQAGQPDTDTSYYSVIMSKFEAKLFGGSHEPKELPRRLLINLADKAVDQLMNESNDLVVNTSSMTWIDGPTSHLVKDLLDFGENSQVYHTNYFTRPEVVTVLSKWLDLTKIELPPSSNRYQVRPHLAEPGSIVSTELPSSVNTNVLTATAMMTVTALKERIATSSSDYVIVQRHLENTVKYFVYVTEDVLNALEDKEPQQRLIDIFTLNERRACPQRTVAQIVEHLDPLPDVDFTYKFIVIVDEGQPVGVLPIHISLPSSEELAAMAKADIDRVGKISRPITTRGGTRRNAKSIEEFSVVEEEVTYETESTSRLFHFSAGMDNEVVINNKTTLTVIVAPETIAQIVGEQMDSGKAEVDLRRKLILDVMPRRNFDIEGDNRVELEPSKIDDEVELYFDLMPTDIGEGEVRVIARQGQFPLVTLQLTVRIVEEKSKQNKRVSVVATAAEPRDLWQPISQFTIFEEYRGSSFRYRYELDLPKQEVFDKFESDFIETDLQEYINNLYSRIEERWLNSEKDVENFTEELRAMGGSLLDELFPAKLKKILWENRHDIDSIQVISEDPFIPWELVHLKEPDQPLPDETCFLGQLGMVRWLHGSRHPNSLQVRQGQVRYLIPDYPHPDDKLPETQEEMHFLVNTFQALAVEPEKSALRSLLRQPGSFDLLHFAGHGVAQSDKISEASLMLQGRIENDHIINDYFSAEEVEQFSRLRTSDNKRPMIVINACQTGRQGFKLTKIGGFAQAFLKSGAGAFIGTLWSVGDSPARVFTETFYLAVQDGKSLSEAATMAREAAREAGDGSWLAYVVYGHPHARLDME